LSAGQIGTVSAGGATLGLGIDSSLRLRAGTLLETLQSRVIESAYERLRTGTPRRACGWWTG
jgi:hypothetical protein